VKRSETIPTGPEIERFLITIVQYVIPRNPSGVPSVNWVKRGIACLVKMLTFSYPEFKLSAHDAVNIRSRVHALRKEGKLTTSAVREKQWLGVYYVRLLVNALLKQALEEGTRNWDVTLSCCTSILLVAAICARSGDIARSRSYDDTNALLWGDIRITMPAMDSTLQDLRAMVTIRCEKGHR
jgi:hypothetical protein